MLIMLKKVLLPALAVFFIVAVSSPAHADVIKLKSGQSHEGEITAEEEGRVQIKLATSGVRLWFSRDQISSLEKTESDKDSEEDAESDEEGSPIAADDDASRAREMLEKMRAEAKEPQYKSKRNQKSSKKGAPASAPKPQATASLGQSDVEALVQQMRSGKTIYVKLNACKKLGDGGATDAIPDLIRALEDGDHLLRKAANESLIKITGQDFGYNHIASGSARLWAIEKWDDWYDEIKKKEAREQLKSSLF